MLHSRKRSAFTLIELLVVIAIIAILIDGSVRPISKILLVTYDPPPQQWMMFQAVCGMNDGVTPDYSQLTR